MILELKHIRRDSDIMYLQTLLISLQTKDSPFSFKYFYIFSSVDGQSSHSVWSYELCTIMS